MYNRLFKYLFFLIIFFNSSAISIENKIILKIDNIIITSIDVLNEVNYLKALNPSLKNLDENKMLTVAKDSLIREKIKKIEISKFNITNIDNKYLEDLIKSIYTNIGLKNKEEFVSYINSFGINLTSIEEKLSSETHWNQLIYNKFFSKLKIDKNKIKEEIQKNKEKSRSYLLYEIVYSADQNIKSEELFKDIQKSIFENGFENAAAIFSISESAKTGGNIGWVNENTMNKKILKEINDLKIGQHTNPILIPGGFLILKIKDQKEIEKKIDIKKELNSRIRLLQNQQLNQFSNIYFQKIKKNISINEK
jgi:peptidyl-prolyl cis-trans isomerase SurA